MTLYYLISQRNSFAMELSLPLSLSLSLSLSRTLSLFGTLPLTNTQMCSLSLSVTHTLSLPVRTLQSEARRRRVKHRLSKIVKGDLSERGVLHFRLQLCRLERRRRS